ncbi:MAG: hypothetical protein HONBIEJF_00947 [Fimbriimonadaceae bacterium]|nr:hypothetical protein [Fimbriimonadaceae bacterium]
MDPSRLRLVQLSPEWKDAYRDFADEIIQNGDERWYQALRELSIEDLIAKREREHRGLELPEGIVPQTIFWLVNETGSILAELRLRHRLNAALLKEGGHIGYIVRPTARQQGVGTEMLRRGLQQARRLGLERVLITCDDANLGSIGVIEANGGSEYETGVSPHTGGPTRLYWIQTPVLPLQ